MNEFISLYGEILQSIFNHQIEAEKAKIEVNRLLSLTTKISNNYHKLHALSLITNIVFYFECLNENKENPNLKLTGSLEAFNECRFKMNNQIEPVQSHHQLLPLVYKALAEVYTNSILDFYFHTTSAGYFQELHNQINQLPDSSKEKSKLLAEYYMTSDFGLIGLSDGLPSDFIESWETVLQ